MSVKETHLKGTPESVIKYVSEQKEAQTVHFSEDETSNYYAENGPPSKAYLAMSTTRI